MPLIRLVAAMTLALTGAADAAYFVARSTATSAPPSADAYFAASGVDSGGTMIGADCTYASPCRTFDKLLAFHAAQVARNPARNYSYVMLSSFGSYAVDATKLYNSTHTVSAGYTTTIKGWPGKAVLEAGVDTAGTWSSTTLTNGTGVSACISNALASYAPLVDGTTTTTADRYAGEMWIGGRRVQPPIWPRIGADPDTIGPLLTVGTAAGSYVQGAPNATFTNGSASISIDDLTQIGIVGDTFGVEAAIGGFGQSTRYWILTKSAATGSGTITVSATPGGSAKSSTAGGTVKVEQRTLPNNKGQRFSVVSDKNSFPVGAGYNSAKGDGKVWLHAPQGSGSSLIPIASATSTLVTLQSSAFTSGSSWVYAGQRLRRWNVWEDLGSGGAKGEMWTDRTTGLIYYVPLSGETCASLNADGRAIIPGKAESILRISSATADGSTSGATVGNLALKDISFRHTNTSVWTGRHNLAGHVGGYIGGGNSFQFMTLEPALAFVGASNVSLDGIEATQLGGSGIAAGWGSNHVSIANTLIKDVGGAGIVAGGDMTYFDPYHFNSDSGYVGTGAFGPTTPSYNSGGSATNKDLTAASDCCQTITNSKIQDVGRVHTGSACITGALWQNFTVTNNLVSDCPNGAIQMTSVSAGASSTPGWGSNYPGISIAQAFGSKIKSNILQYVGYGYALDGTRVPGAWMGGDFGLLYVQGGQDGPGDGSVSRLEIAGNIGHDISSSCASYVSSGGTTMARGFDAILDYHDGNSTNGVDETDNLFYNSATVDGRAPCPNRLTQHTGDLRVTYRRNIWAGTFPTGATMPSGYAPRADVGPYPYSPFRSTAYTCSTGAGACFTINQGRLYTATASGATGSAGAEPTCTSGTCADGSVTWAFVQAMPGVTATDEQSNITAWAVTGGGNTDYPHRGFQGLYPQFTAPDKNLYFQSGKTMVNYTAYASTVTWSAWQALGKEANSSPLWNADPNFVDMTGASGWQGFKFKSSGTGSACSGTGGVSPACGVGFVPYDFSSAGPNW